ncbi:hypothetical protein V6N12_038423 [Hibiscus sabdariffa]|uniref:Uncharacterized protein n=1 Tax=Hibiscus sabdariffa TaxID=183260 RepID=A0ABR2BEX4_9ROSI
MSFQDLKAGRALASRQNLNNDKQDATQAVASGIFQINTASLPSSDSSIPSEQKTQSEQMNKCMAEVVEESLVEDEEEEELREFSATIANGIGMFKQSAGGNKIK